MENIKKIKIMTTIIIIFVVSNEILIKLTNTSNYRQFLLKI